MEVYKPYDDALSIFVMPGAEVRIHVLQVSNPTTGVDANGKFLLEKLEFGLATPSECLLNSLCELGLGQRNCYALNLAFSGSQGDSGTTSAG